ncbi:MAG: hypothetical protein P8X68_03115 [Desulfobacterales bacterium]|jgi:phenylpyruvate tautomerase PptA (4-oxalocrotonate tautomerase family)
MVEKEKSAIGTSNRDKPLPSTKPKAFKAKRVTRRYIQTLNAEPSVVHALICPVRETEWLDGWDYDLIFSQSGLAEAGCVFISRNKGEKDTIWMITKRDDQNFETEFARITPESRVASLTIRIEDGGNHTSRMHIAYTFTALNEEGNRFIENFTEQNFVQDMKFWEAALNHYLETGRPLPRSDREHWLKYESVKREPKKNR